MSSPAHSRSRPFTAEHGASVATGLPGRPEPTAAQASLDRLQGDPAYQAFVLLRVGFAVAPILFGLDKFANVLVDWPTYLAPWVVGLLPIGAADAMHVVGAVEILAGVAVAVRPRHGAYLVAAWLGGIIVNLLTYPGYYDVALRDFGLMVGALALGRLAAEFDAPSVAPERRPAAAVR